MAAFTIKGKKLMLTGDPTALLYTVEFAGQVWSMTQKPYVQFSDGKKMELYVWLSMVILIYRSEFP